MSEAPYAFLERTCREAFGLRLEAEAFARIERFIEILELWNQRLRLSGERSRSSLLRKHVVDSLSCAAFLPLEGRALDIGTGAGFPGVVLACVRSDIEMTLLDSRQRPISFLREVIRRVPLPHAQAIAMRAEEAGLSPGIAGQQRLVTSRALRIDVFLPLARPLLASGGLAISMQTPSIDRAAAEAMVRRFGFGLAELRDYRLPDGEPRRLVVAR